MSTILKIEKTKYTPSILFDSTSNLLQIEGQSYPENAYSFFQPLLDKLEATLQSKESQTLCVDLRLVYINTSSFKIILDIMDMLDSAFEQGFNITVNWYYDPENDVAKETGEEIKEDLSLPFNMIEEEM
jgi:hypothetical protein